MKPLSYTSQKYPEQCQELETHCILPFSRDTNQAIFKMHIMALNIGCIVLRLPHLCSVCTALPNSWAIKLTANTAVLLSE